MNSSGKRLFIFCLLPPTSFMQVYQLFFAPLPQAFHESLLSTRQKWQWTEVSEANEGLMPAQMKAQQRFLKRLSWVPCDRTERIRRSRQATETSCVPILGNQALTNFSWVFFYSWEHWGNTENWYGKLNSLFWKLQILQVFSPVFTVSAWKSMKFQTWTT